MRHIVITSIHPPNKAIEGFAAMTESHVVVAGDLKSPSRWEHPNCTFLDVEAQKKLPHRIVEQLPWNHYGRKMLGYLHAIGNGAKTTRPLGPWYRSSHTAQSPSGPRQNSPPKKSGWRTRIPFGRRAAASGHRAREHPELRKSPPVLLGLLREPGPKSGLKTVTDSPIVQKQPLSPRVPSRKF